LETEDILSLVRGAARQWPRREALCSESDGSLCYEELRLRIEENAVRLGGLNPGRRVRVGIAMPNGLGMAVTLLSVTVVGTALPFNPKYREEELQSYFRETAIDLLLVRDRDPGPAVSAAHQLGIPVLAVDAGGSILLSPRASFVPQAPRPEETALVLLTSGSTGRAKAVPLTHRNLCTSAGDVGRSMQLCPEDRCLSMWEQFHIGGLVDLLLAPLLSGGCVLCTPGFDPEEFFRLLKASGPTWFQGVPTTLNELVHYSRKREIVPGPHQLRLVRSVAAPLPPETQEAVGALLGVPVIQTYGLTEAGPLVTSTDLSTASAKPRSLGRSCGTEIRICTDGWAAAPRLTVGAIAIRGRNVFSGYENDPEANAAQFRDGWFLTGDIGYLDEEGDLFVTGRTKQLINRGGEKVNPQEVDEALLGNPAVAMAASFPVPHRTLGEDVAAAIVLREGCQLSEDGLGEFLRQRLAGFKIPSRFWFLNEIPTNTIGKIDRLALTAMARESVRAEVSRTPPGDALQHFLAEVWASELDLDFDQIDIDGDFGSLGGDSLSRARIVVLVEKAFGIKLRDEVVASFTTIRKMAAWLALAIPDGHEVAAAARLNGRSVVPEVAELQGVDVPVRPEEEEAEAERGWAACDHASDIKVTLDRILLYRTPGEVRDWLASTGAWPALRSLPWGRAPLRSMRVALRKRRSIREIEKHFEGVASIPQWSRSVVTENSVLYTDAAVAKCDKTLVLGFCGTLHRLMIPVYNHLIHLDPQSHDLLLIRDPTRNHFENGTPGLGDSVETVAESLSRYVGQSGYRRTIAFGTSGGGLAAICVGLINGFDKIIAVSPDSPLRHLPLERCLAKLARQQVHSVPMQVFYGVLNGRDREGAEQVANYLPGAKLFPEATSNHNLIHEFNEQRKLGGFLRQVLVA
jgi:acyl-CoA synthetase (AMP-forming)/AMP-acid ligase II/acyl carrier protein